jgi:hypothetical protein
MYLRGGGLDLAPEARSLLNSRKRHHAMWIGFQ